jgi:hypothetical protein
MRRDRGLFRQHLRETDIFVVGHPKSGNTWVAYMLAVFLKNDREGHVTLANIGEHAPGIHGRDSIIEKYPTLRDPRVFRNEWPVFPNLYPRSIYLLRDPRAVLLSYFHMYQTMFDDRTMPLRAFIEEYLEHGYIRRFEPLVRWDRQVMAWKHRADRDANALVVRYEDLVADRRGTMRRIAEFTEVGFTEARLDLAVERGSFPAMRAIEDQYGAESYPGGMGRRGHFIRRGRVDAWKEEMTPEIARMIEVELRPAMEAIGYL